MKNLIIAVTERSGKDDVALGRVSITIEDLDISKLKELSKLPEIVARHIEDKFVLEGVDREKVRKITSSLLAPPEDG